jgi:hypothetical protein
MDWEFKGLKFQVKTEALGAFWLASARVPSVGAFVRVRPFSSLGRSEEEALQLLKRQIEFEFRKLPVA